MAITRIMGTVTAATREATRAASRMAPWAKCVVFILLVHCCGICVFFLEFIAAVFFFFGDASFRRAQ